MGNFLGFPTLQLPANSGGHPVVFQTLHDKPIIPKGLFWVAMTISFLIANAPPGYISAILFRVLQVLPAGASVNVLPPNEDLRQLSNQITTVVFVPLKELFFLASLIVIVCPIVRCVSRSKHLWRALVTKQALLFSLSLFLALACLVFPYSYPNGRNSHPSGLAGLGIRFAQMSIAPFQEWDPLYYKRVLKPALAHFLQLDGYLGYYLFSLLCTYILIFLIVSFWESKFLATRGDVNHVQSLDPKVKWLVFLSVMTSSFVLINFQRPGYSDQVSHILVLLMATIPMTAQARLATVTLSLLNHESIALALVPVILFCFPKEERITALMVVGLFYGIVAAGYGFSATRALEGQGSVMDNAGSVWEAAFHAPGLFLAGLFFTYKLLWIPFALALWMLWKQREKATLSAIAAITLFPLSLTLVAWDTTRVAGFGWLGMLIALGLLLQGYQRLPRFYHYALVALACVNLLIPTYNVIIFYKDSLSNYFDPGLYMLIVSVARQLVV